ncbi:Zinc finger MYND domain-containing protein 10 [Sorochytrium milnesiophthora]
MNAESNVISAHEAERVIELLQRLTIDQIASDKWIKQHEALEKLNLQAHYNVATNVEEFVTEAFVTFDKTNTVIYDLLVSECWKAKVFPLLYRKVLPHASLTLYFVLFHEAVLVNLLEIMMYNKELAKSCGETLLDLTDYCSRKIGLLNAWDDEDDIDQPVSKEILTATKDDEHILKQKRTIDFSVALTSLSVVRYLSEHIVDLPLSVMTRMLNTNDLVCALVYLMENAPWKQRSASGQYKVFDGTSWKVVPEEDRLLVGSIEGQVWLALYNLLVEPECQRKYECTDHRRATILRLKKQFESNATLLDQIPPLEGLLRYLEHLTMMTPPDSATAKRGLWVEEMPQLLEEIQRCQDWAKLADTQARTVFSKNASRQLDFAKSMSSVYDFGGLEDLLDDPKCGRCGAAAEQRCSRCRIEWYCSRACQVKAWKGHKALCDLVTDSDKRHGKSETLSTAAEPDTVATRPKIEEIH